jgi:hypothetical protein
MELSLGLILSFPQKRESMPVPMKTGDKHMTKDFLSF